MYLGFAFEGDLHQTLEFIPLAVRRKLDLAGLKPSLAAWTALTRAEKLAVCHLPVDGPGDLDVYREALQGFAHRAGHVIEPLESERNLPSMIHVPRRLKRIRDGLRAE